MKILNRLLCLHLALLSSYSYAISAENPIIIDDIIVTEEICELENGSLTIIVNGTYTDLIYSVDNGRTFQESNYFGNLGSGDYIAVVADASSCSETFSIQIVDAPLPLVDIDFECEPQRNRVNVNLIPFSTGIQPFSYNWTGPNGVTYDSQNLDQVEPGTYNVTVTDRIGCAIDTTLIFPICCELIVECNEPDTTYLNCTSEVPAIDALFLDNNTANDLNELTRIGIDVREKCSDITVAVYDEYDTNQECGTGPLLYKRIYRIEDGSNVSTCENILFIDNYGDIVLQSNPQQLQISCDDDIDLLLNDWIQNIAGAEIKTCSPTYNVSTVPDILTVGYSCIGTGELEVEFTITDDCNNKLQFVSTVNVTDTEAPNITCPNSIEVSAVASDFEQQIDTWLQLYDSSDNCSNVTVIDDYNFNNLTFDCDAESLEVQFVSTDDCGNTNDCVTTILITDIFTPDIICPETLTIQCGGLNNDFLISEWIGMATATGYNNTAIAIDNDYDQTRIEQSSCGTPVPVRFFAENACLQGLECMTSIQVVDVISPDIACPPALSLINGDDNYHNMIDAWLSEVVATDNCGAAIVSDDFDISQVDFCDNNGDITVEFVAVDECSNMSICQSLILLTPYSLSLECPDDIIIDCNESVDADIEEWLLSASAVENGIEIITVDNDFIIADLNRSCDGVTEVNFTALSSCIGSDENCVSTIMIIDTISPDIVCPQDLTIELGSEEINYISEYLQSITATDECHAIEYTNDWDSENINVQCSEDIEVRFVATDECGNSSECMSLLTLSANASIEIICPEEYSIYCNDNLLDNKIVDHISRVEVISTLDYEISNNLDLEIIDRECEQDYYVDVDISGVDLCGNENICVTSIHIYPPPKVYIPNIFSPASQSADDVFTVFSNSSVVEVVSMIVFDRWGSPVFEQENFPPNDTDYGWDGYNNRFMEQSNVMTYHIIVTGILGEELEYMGSVQVMK